MLKDHYVRLIERMNMNVVKHPPTPAMIDILKILFTEEQAALAADFPLGAHTAATLSEQLGRNVNDLKKMLTQMSHEGLVFEAKDHNGVPEYSILPFEPGLMEMQLLHGKTDENTRKIVALKNLVSKQESALMKEVFKDSESIKKVIPKPIGRLLAIEEQISADKQVADWERVSQIVEMESSYAVGECGCKHIAKLNNEPCQSGAPSKCCIWFGKMADYLVERNLADRYDKAQIYSLLKECEDAGLVHFTSNMNLSENIVMCNCCKCCCLYLKKQRFVRDFGVQMTANTNFVVRLDHESCVACGECVDYCQLEALEISNDTLTINDSYCLGCGACAAQCPTESLSLVRISNNKPPAPEVPLAGPGV
jgi:Pyruvate/2-oxoacid:ferredoxin oxidoreductase delta subunit